MIRVEGLSKTFEADPILRGIDLQVADREILAVMGSSGGGKTTLLRCISGLVPPTEGLVEVDGVDVRTDPERARRTMGMVFQNAALFDSMTVLQNVLFGLERQTSLPASKRLEKAKASIEDVGLAEGDSEKFPSELSGGMRKRVGLARAIALEPKILLYDEPTTGLDPITTFAIDRLIVRMRDSLGVTSLLVSHDLASVVRVADRVAFLHAGELAFDGSPSDFLDAPHPAIRELVETSHATTLD